jgi:pyruvate/2-oxoglutarate dehydrogenase complex dihydrolipoamide acyltransferase (E2) component
MIAPVTIADMSIKIEMPRLSDTMTQGIVTRWAKSAGDSVSKGDLIAEVEVDGTVIELLVADSGVIKAILAKEGAPVSEGQALALLSHEVIAEGSSEPILISPLARKIAKDRHVDCSLIKGSGPRGKIMSADVLKADVGHGKSEDYPIMKVADVDPKVASVVARIGDFFVFSFNADMSELAKISIPIAVQCEKLMGGRFSLFDYVARASVRACKLVPEWLHDEINLMMISHQGDLKVSIPNASKKSIYKIALKRLGVEAGEPCCESNTNLLLCDAGVVLKEVRNQLPDVPAALVALGGTSSKLSIEAGRPVSKLLLPVTIYLNASTLDWDSAARIAAEFKTLLENPVLLLF